MKNHASANRIYRLVWNAAAGTWVAVAEKARGRGKSGSARSRVNLAALTLMGSLLLPVASIADVTGAVIVGGTGSIAQTSNSTTITQASQRLAVDFNTLSTAVTDSFTVAQPNAQAIALLRVLGSSPSELLGSFSANGQVFISNPNGILFGAGAQVNVGGLVASTLSMSPADFMAGGGTFANNGSSGSVINRGTLTAAPGGYLALLAPEVRNEGVMTASLGTALLAAGNKVTLNIDNGSLLGYSIDQGAINALADNKQLIQADGGQVILSAKAMDSLTTATVNNTGIIEARTIQSKAGRILLMGDMDSGTVNVAGTLDASAPGGGDGGFIETSAARVNVADSAKVTTLAGSGDSGTWLIDPTDYTIAASGGNMTGAALSAGLAGGNVTILSFNGTAGVNGDVNIDDVVSWSANTLTLHAERNVNINSSMSGSGTGKLALEYGQGAVAAGNTGTYNVRATIDLAAGDNFSTKLGSDGAVTQYKVITALGAEGSVTGTDLQGINANPTGNFVLGANIDASVTNTWNGGFDTLGGVNNFIGTFDGKFDGLGHTIKNLYINRPGDNFVGLFGQTQGATIQNVGLVGGSITGQDFVGALVGQACCSVISNVFSSASVTGQDQGIGGLIGLQSNGSLNNSYATGAVTGNSSVGGLVGASYGAITNSYSSGLVTSAGTKGGLLGDDQGSTITSSYWNITTSGLATSAGGTGKTAAEMTQLATFAGWDISASGPTLWQLAPGQAGPGLRSFTVQAAVAEPAGVTPVFSGSEAYRAALVYIAGVSRTPQRQDADTAVTTATAALNDSANDDPK